MKVLWLAPFPYVDNKEAHPAPWIISLANVQQVQQQAQA